MVPLTPEQIKASGIEVVAIGRGGGGSTRLSGRVEPSVGARASVASTVTGRVERVLVAPGTAVKQNQALAIVVSGEAAVFRANALAASAEAEAARLAYGRDKALVDQGVVARQELEASRARSLAAQAQAAAAQAQRRQRCARCQWPRAHHQPGGRHRRQRAGHPGWCGRCRQRSRRCRRPVDERAGVHRTAGAGRAGHAGHEAGSECAGGSFTATVTGSAADVRQQGGVAVIRATPVDASLPPAGSPVSAVVVTEGQDGSLSVPADAVQNVDGSSAVFVAVEGGFKAQPVLAGVAPATVSRSSVG